MNIVNAAYGPIVPLTPQQIFDNALFGVRSQKHAPSALFGPAGNVTCLYRGPRGLKCGIGHSIPDEVYDPGFESLGVNCLADPDSELAGSFNAKTVVLFSRASVDFLLGVQRAHDSMVEGYVVDDDDDWAVPGFEREMAKLARLHSLVYTPVEAPAGSAGARA